MELVYTILIWFGCAMVAAWLFGLLGKSETQPALIDTEESVADETIEAYFSSLRKDRASEGTYRLRGGPGAYAIENRLTGYWYTAGANRELVEELIKVLNGAKCPIVEQKELNVIRVKWNDHEESDEHVWVDTFNFN